MSLSATVPIQVIRTGPEDKRPRKVHTETHRREGFHPEDPPTYLPEVRGVSLRLTEKYSASFIRYRRQLCHETKNLTRFGETGNRLSFRHCSKSGRNQRSTIQEEEEKYSEDDMCGDRQAVRHSFRPYYSRAAARLRGGNFTSDGGSPESDSDEGPRPQVARP